MTVRIITSWSALIKLAHELGQAKLSKDKNRIAEAQYKHDVYRDICLDSDEMMLPITKF